jgi:hypothetical protein
MKYVSRLIIITSFLGCTKSTYHIYSPNKDQCITFITHNDTRYIVAGKYNSVPESNFVKIDISKVDRNAGDQIIGCWKRNKLEWTVMMNGVTILENKLDTNKFLFQKNFPVDRYGSPNVLDYDRRKKNCFSLDFEYYKLRRIEGDAEQ